MTGNFFNPIFQFRFKQSLHLGNTDFTEQEVKVLPPMIIVMKIRMRMRIKMTMKPFHLFPYEP